MHIDPVLVFDTTSESAIPKKYRTNLGMNVSASGQFSAAELKEMLHAIPKKPQHIWIIDLRQESHAFINGLPVTWSADQNGINKDKSALQIARHEKALINSLKQQQLITVYTLKKLNAGKITAVNPIKITPYSIMSEQELVTDLGAKYKRFYVLDHNRPDDYTVDEYVDFVKKNLANNDWMHFHCRGGKGRSSTFIAMFDMMANAKHASFDDIMQRQAAMGNIKLNALPTKADKLWKVNALKERYLFLQKFYAYVLDPDGFECQSWSEWLESHSSN